MRRVFLTLTQALKQEQIFFRTKLLNKPFNHFQPFLIINNVIFNSLKKKSHLSKKMTPCCWTMLLEWRTCSGRRASQTLQASPHATPADAQLHCGNLSFYFLKNDAFPSVFGVVSLAPSQKSVFKE